MDTTISQDLLALKQGESAYILRLPPYRGVQRKLISLGLVPGTRITYIRGGHMQPLVLEREGCQIVIGRHLAQSITISMSPPDEEEINEFYNVRLRLFSPHERGHHRNRHLAGAKRYGH